MPLPEALADPLHTGPALTVLHTQALAGERGERRLFESLDMDLPAGSVTWLRGRNGRGKTTLLRLLAGLSSPADGEITIQGRSLRQAGPIGRKQWLYIGHQNALKDDLSATEALGFLARLHGLPDDASSLKQALQRLGVLQRQHAPVRTLSQGQRRRVALARLALSGAAPLWLLDEPFDALDSDGIDALNQVIGEHAAAGGCVLLTSHQALSLRDPAPRLLDLEGFAPGVSPGIAPGIAPGVAPSISPTAAATPAPGARP